MIDSVGLEPLQGEEINKCGIAANIKGNRLKDGWVEQSIVATEVHNEKSGYPFDSRYL